MKFRYVTPQLPLSGRFRLFMLQFSFVTAALVFLLMQQQVYGQTGAEEKFDFSVKDLPLQEIFARLSERRKVNFSYNPGELQSIAPVTYQGTSKNLREHLTAILSQSGFYFKFVGNQIVVFRPGIPVTEQTPPEQQVIVSEEKPVITDTLKTIFPQVIVPQMIRDTIIRTDTIVRIDTVFITPEPARQPETRSSLRFEPDRGRGWSAGVYAGPMFNNYAFTSADNDQAIRELVEETESVSFRNLVAGAGINYHRNNWLFSGSVQFTGFANRFRHSYEQTTGGYYVVDTLDVYYTVVLTDTTWIYITDSSYLPLDEKNYSISQWNTFGYIDVQLGIQYILYRKRDFRLYARSAVNIGRLIYAKGGTIDPVTGLEEIDFDSLGIRKAMISWQAGLGFRQKLTDWIDITAEAWYRGSLNDMFIDYPVERKYKAFGLQAGLIYYF